MQSECAGSEPGKSVLLFFVLLLGFLTSIFRLNRDESFVRVFPEQGILWLCRLGLHGGRLGLGLHPLLLLGRSRLTWRNEHVG